MLWFVMFDVLMGFMDEKGGRFDVGECGALEGALSKGCLSL